MSVRPQMNLVFGIENFDGHLDFEELEHTLNIKNEANSYLKYTFKDGDIVDFLYWGGWFGSNKILGMKVNQTLHDSDFVRVLSLLHPEYATSGYVKIEPWDKDEHFLYAKQIEKRFPECGDIEFQWGWFYDSVIEAHYMWPVHAYCTRFLLKQTGVKVDYHDFELFLVWDWS